MNHYPYDAALFDLDGVLTSTTALQDALRAAAADIVVDDLEELVP
jgi:beta-phosphoglucomutase-like phosphatase (HAD superfamily)